MATRKWVGRAPMPAAPLFLVALIVSSAMADGKYQSNLVPVAVTYDAGNDVDSDGTNDIRPMPVCYGVPADQTTTLCRGGDSSGSECKIDADCQLTAGHGTCGAYDVPDGITEADKPNTTFSCVARRSKVQIKDTTLKATIALSGSPPDTQESGFCDILAGSDVMDNMGNLLAGKECEKDSDCRAADKTKFRCVNGDEFYLQCTFLVGSNLDETPACGGVNQGASNSCLTAITAQGATGGADPTPSNADGGAGTCTGGSRNGFICQSNDDCKGTCTGGGNEACLVSGDCPAGETCTSIPPGTCSCTLATPLNDSLSGDEVCFIGNSPNQGTFFTCPLCPFEIQIDNSFEVKYGRGKVKVKLDEGALKMFVPDGVPIDVLGCYVHEPGPTDKLSVLGFFVNEADQVSNTRVPCADISMPLSAQAGINVDAPVSPIICATGGIGEKGGGKFFKP